MAIIAGGIDITARHEEAEARERERAFLNAIANEAPSLLCLIDERGVLAPTASNKAFERTLEVAPEETGGTVFWDTYVAPEDSARVRALIGRVAAGETVGHHDHTWITKSGRRLAVSWSCIRLPSIDERRLLLVSGVDVTVRKQRELQLQHERDITNTLMQAIPSIVCVVDREGMVVDSGVDSGRAAVNEAFREALGWSDESIVRHERARADRRRRRVLRAHGDRVCRERRRECAAREPLAAGRRRASRDGVDGDAGRRRHRPGALARAPLGHRRHRATQAGGGDPRLARAHHRGCGRCAQSARAEPPRRRAAASRGALCLVATRRDTHDHRPCRRGGDHQGGPRGARGRSRGAAGARPRHPSRGSDRPWARGGRGGPRHPDARAGRA